VAANTNADRRYLDIGCSEGKITDAIIDALNIKKENAFACDVMPIGVVPNHFTFVQNQPIGPLPFTNDQFDLLTMFMSSHHFNNSYEMYKEANRILKNGGYLIIREHNSSTEAQQLFLDAIHALYECVLGDETTPEKFVVRYSRDVVYASYKNADSWITIAEMSGFKLVKKPFFTKDRFASFYAMFIKSRESPTSGPLPEICNYRDLDGKRCTNPDAGNEYHYCQKHNDHEEALLNSNILKKDIIYEVKGIKRTGRLIDIDPDGFCYHYALNIKSANGKTLIQILFYIESENKFYIIGYIKGPVDPEDNGRILDEEETFFQGELPANIKMDYPVMSPEQYKIKKEEWNNFEHPLFAF
jgi:SAM-dependent methyltransferase